MIRRKILLFIIICSIGLLSSLQFNTIRKKDIVLFGKYEQDGDITNGKEPLEWIVLDENETELYLLCQYAIDTQPYNEKCCSTSWDKCTLRIWLNNVFYNDAFSEDEQSRILVYENKFNKTLVDDKVTLITTEEASELGQTVNKCTTSPYTESNSILSFDNLCYWWTRNISPYDDFKAITVNPYGLIEKNGTLVSYSFIGVRPVILVKK